MLQNSGNLIKTMGIEAISKNWAYLKSLTGIRNHFNIRA